MSERGPSFPEPSGRERAIAALGAIGFRIEQGPNAKPKEKLRSTTETESEHVKLTDEEMVAIAVALEGIAEQRTELKEKDPREFILGITEGRKFLSVDELYGVNLGEERFIVRYSPLEHLVDGKPLQEQRMLYGDVSRFRDGGTTNMPTQFGHIFYPSPYRQAPTTLDSETVTPLVELLPAPEAK